MVLQKKITFLTCLAICIIALQCSSSGQNRNINLPHFEGYVDYSNQLFRTTDSKNYAIDVFDGDTGRFFNINRTMMIWGDYLIDIIPNNHVDENGHRKIDTTEYTFYDLKHQRFIGFKNLRAGSEIIRRGRMADEGGSYSSDPQFDPFNLISDSAWNSVDTIIDGRGLSLVSFHVSDCNDQFLASRVKFWVDKKIKNFPIQLSHILSKKIDKGFVYRMQLPFSEQPPVMVTSLDYRPAKIPDSIINLMKTWARLVDSTNSK